MLLSKTEYQKARQEFDKTDAEAFARLWDDVINERDFNKNLFTVEHLFASAYLPNTIGSIFIKMYPNHDEGMDLMRRFHKDPFSISHTEWKKVLWPHVPAKEILEKDRYLWLMILDKKSWDELLRYQKTHQPNIYSSHKLVFISPPGNHLKVRLTTTEEANKTNWDIVYWPNNKMTDTI